MLRRGRVLSDVVRSFANAAPENRLMHIEKQFESVPTDKRNKEAFMAAVTMFKEKKSRSHVEFINSALKYIKEYGIHKDLDTYKTLLNIFPKGKMIPQNTFQKIFLHFPMQQNCCVKVLDEMEWNCVQPDKEIHDIVVNAFGEWNFATKKVKRMLYWMPKLKHSNKYLDRRHVEGKTLGTADLAGLALRMMARDPGTSIDLVKLDEVGETWAASAQSLQQRRLIDNLPDATEIFVDGPFRVYIMEHAVPYVTVTTAPTRTSFEDFKEEENDDFARWFSDWEKRRKDGLHSIHEQKHETILAVGAMHPCENATAMQWMDHLTKKNPALARMCVRLRLDRGADQFVNQEPIVENTQQAN